MIASTLSASTESNAWTNEALNLVAARTEKLVCARKFKDYDAAKVYEMAEMQELERLKQRTERYLSSGRIAPGW